MGKGQAGLRSGDSWPLVLLNTRACSTAPVPLALNVCLCCCASLQALGWALYSSALAVIIYLVIQAVAGVAYW